MKGPGSGTGVRTRNKRVQTGELNAPKGSRPREGIGRGCRVESRRRRTLTPYPFPGPSLPVYLPQCSRYGYPHTHAHPHPHRQEPLPRNLRLPVTRVVTGSRPSLPPMNRVHGRTHLTHPGTGRSGPSFLLLGPEVEKAEVVVPAVQEPGTQFDVVEETDATLVLTIVRRPRPLYRGVPTLNPASATLGAPSNRSRRYQTRTVDAEADGRSQERTGPERRGQDRTEVGRASGHEQDTRETRET